MVVVDVPPLGLVGIHATRVAVVSDAGTARVREQDTGAADCPLVRVAQLLGVDLERLLPWIHYGDVVDEGSLNSGAGARNMDGVGEGAGEGEIGNGHVVGVDGEKKSPPGVGGAAERGMPHSTQEKRRC